MADEQRVVVRVSTASKALVDEVAIERDVTAGEAADLLMRVGHSRLAALAKYAERGDRAVGSRKRKRAPSAA